MRQSLFLLPLLAPGLPLAAGGDELSEHLFFEEMPTVLTASRIQQPLDHVPAAITVIDREMIEASGVLEVVDLLRLVPGFQVAYVTGHTFSATYR
ncbi:MAG: hypothetical protein G8D28_05670 [gamma proteobacterium symbiont of Phacoides pectinatus]